MGYYLEIGVDTDAGGSHQGDSNDADGFDAYGAVGDGCTSTIGGNHLETIGGGCSSATAISVLIYIYGVVERLDV